MMEQWLEKVNNAQTLDELDEIIEHAAWDDSITHDEYCFIYQHAIEITQNWRCF